MTYADVYAEKAQFVRNILSPMLEGMGCGIEGADYGADMHGDEWVEVVFANGSALRVNVSCDSPFAIACDVLDALEGHV